MIPQRQSIVAMVGIVSDRQACIHCGWHRLQLLFLFWPGVTRVANHCDRTSLGLVLLLCRPNGAAPHQSRRAPPHRGDLKPVLFYCRKASLRRCFASVGSFASETSPILSGNSRETWRMYLSCFMYRSQNEHMR